MSYTPSRPWLYLPDGWDSAWRSAKANAGTTAARVLVQGDSVAAGEYASNCVTKSWVGVLRDTIATRLGGLAADYLPAYGLGSGFWTSMNNAPWTGLLNGHTAITSINYSWHAFAYPSDAGATVDWHQTFTSPMACTAMDLFYVDYNGGTFQYSVDGGTAQTVTCTGPGRNNQIVSKVSLTGLASATHTVSIGHQSSGFVALPLGIACYPTGTGAHGLKLARFTTPGAMTADYDNTANPNQSPAERFLLHSGVSPQSASGSGHTYGYPTQPHLTIVALGLNDCNAVFQTSSYLAVLQRLIHGVRAGTPNASILFLIYANPTSTFSDYSGTQYAPATWTSYTQQIYLLAEHFQCAVLNIDAKWGESPVGSGFMSNANGIHPTDAGHADIAASLLTVL